jgi:hypothetical protein
MKNAVFWEVTPGGCYKNRRTRNKFLSRRFLSPEAIRSSETSVLTRVTLCHIPEDGICHSYRRENLRAYKLKPVCYSWQYNYYLAA